MEAFAGAAHVADVAVCGGTGPEGPSAERRSRRRWEVEECGGKAMADEVVAKRLWPVAHGSERRGAHKLLVRAP
ncbi:Os11g0428500 [Oryza sativa Japonica Group]|jgi:hypothetical protein|uniref:Os11g0428500 protein n=2 Tax=Oryza sativa TaxID=4530 RepID=A0A0P0Y1Q7_ORYSJ|nr:hypothetical protein OsI_35936 [Oryza sativa Indica Group]BAT13805.1 Os11g0428500 [Oryza sativa Japonica Group]